MSNGGIFTYGGLTLCADQPRSACVLTTTATRTMTFATSSTVTLSSIPSSTSSGARLKCADQRVAVLRQAVSGGRAYRSRSLDNNLNWLDSAITRIEFCPQRQVVGNAQPGSCGRAAASVSGTGTTAAWPDSGLLDTHSTTPLGEHWHARLQHRNQYHGPHYFDMDLNLFKNFKVGERFNFAIGAQAFNAFNHPNFGQPDNGLR